MTVESDLVLPRQATSGSARLARTSSLLVSGLAPRTGQEPATALHVPPLGRLGQHVVEILVVAVAALATGWLLVGLSGSLALVLALWLLTVYHSGASATSPLRPAFPDLSRHGLMVLGLTALAAHAVPLPATAVPGAAATVLGGSAAVLGIRLVRSSRRSTVRTVLVGDAESVGRLLAQLGATRGVEVVGACVPPDEQLRCPAQHGYDGPVVSSLDAVPRLVRQRGAEVVTVVPGPAFTPEHVRRLGWLLERLPVHLGLIGFPETLAPHRMVPGRLGRHPVVELQRCRRSAFNRLSKAAIDRAVGLLVLLAALPVFGVVTLAVRLDSRGPAFFTQRRVGQGGGTFTLYKFRTMYQDAEARRAELLERHPEAGTILFKLRDDPRITRAGRFLRKFSLDELPQLLNVVKGEMSLIGPRPALPEEVAQYDEAGRRRLAVKPGLTGLWQVSGRSDLSWEDALALDLHYVDNWRLSDDAVIVGRTVHAVLTSKGAY